MLGERAAEFTALIGRLIGLDFDDDRHIAGIADEARQLRDRGFHAIVQYLRALQRQGDAPLVLLLDDLHWADDGSLDFVRYLVGDCADVPMLVVGMTRPALFERRPLGVAGAEPHLRIDLAPLPLDGSRELVGALLARLDTVPAALRDMLTTSAEGNAYFLEELIGMLVDDGVIVTSGERWRLVPDRLLSIKLPGTLAGVLQARLDVLPASERAALQAASVVGHVFWDEVVREIVAGARAGGDTDATLDALAGRDLSHRREPSAFPNSREFAFRHHLVHQVTYQGLLKRTRQVHHRQVADWLVRRSGDRRDEYLAAIAEHYERAGDAANAVAYLRRAGESAARAYANEAALDLFGRALALLPADDAQARIEIIRGRLTVHKVLARRDAHEADVATCERLAETLDDDYSRADAASNRASLMLLLGDYPGVVVAASRAIALADKIGPRAAGLAASCQIHLGRALQAQGDFGSAARHIERSLALASQLGNRTTECIALIQLGIIAMSHGDYGAARLRYHEALENARERGDRVREAAALNNLGDIDQMLGDYRAAQVAFEQCRPIAAEVGAPQLVATLLANLASVAFRRGDAAAAIGFAEQSIASARQNKDVNLVAQACCIHGQALAALGQGAKAATAYEESVAIYRRIGRPTQLPEPLCGLARLALARGAVTEAVALVSEVVAHFDAGGTVDGTEDPAWVHLTCHDVLRANDDSRADEFLARGHAELMTRAAKLAPAERARFLGDVPSHRNLLAACIARGWSEQATWDVAADAAARLSPSP